MKNVHTLVAVLSVTVMVTTAHAQEAAPATPPDGTRLLFGPTARALPKGQVYFGVYEFVMPFVQVGLTDRVSIGGGTPLFVGVDEAHRPFWVTPKAQVLHTDSTDVAVGALHVLVPGEGGGGVGYIVATRGSTRGAFTAGAGLAYDVHGGRSPVVMIGGEHEMRPGLRFVSESYIWKSGKGLASAGVRFCGDKLSADVGLGIPIGLGQVFAFPVINFVYMF
jgi:hypothetical protein